MISAVSADIDIELEGRTIFQQDALFASRKLFLSATDRSLPNDTSFVSYL